jgi:hypothetical protein
MPLRANVGRPAQEGDIAMVRIAALLNESGFTRPPTSSDSHGCSCDVKSDG